jgi:arylsulfatase A-like enzyme
MPRPNILLVLLDQWRYDTLGVNGGTNCRTPRLDALAAQGVRSTRAYTPIAICSSSRASLLTGLYPHAHGMMNNCHEDDAILPDLPAGMPTFSKALREAGYATGYIGKWHAGRSLGPETQGFENAAGTIAEYTRYRLDRGLSAEPEVGDDAVYANIGRLRMLLSGTDQTPLEHSYSAYVVDESLRTLDALAGQNDPFFVQVSFEGPHHPYLIPEPYASMYGPDTIERWPSFADTFAGKPTIHALQMRHRGVEDWTWEQWAPVVAKYFGFVSHLDEQIGRLLDFLDDRDLAENTLIVVSADHGDFAGGHRQFNKGPLMYEDIYHVPMIARWPAGGFTPGSVCDHFVRLLDLGPTFLDAAQAACDWKVHGRSVLPLWNGGTVGDWPQTVFTEYHGDEWGLYSQRMVRGERYKIVYNAQDRAELYDLLNDPAELTNLAEHPGFQGERRNLELELRSWMAKTEDPLRQWSGYLLGLD